MDKTLENQIIREKIIFSVILIAISASLNKTGAAIYHHLE